MKRTRKEFDEWFHEERWNQPTRTRDEWEAKAWADWLNEIEVGDHCHICYYSDVEPCTVIKRTATTITVRKDKAERKFTPEWVPGGFSAICTNIDKQEWEITEDPNGHVETFRRHKDGRWYGSGMKLYPEWMKYYDYNF